MVRLMIEAWIFVFGVVIGSFLNVCICRLPKREEVVKTPSHCPNCKKVLRWYELIPVFSFLLQKGRCRHCGEKISFQYPVVELLNGILYLWVFQRAEDPLSGVLYALAASALVVVSVIDWRTYEIPPGCNWFLGALGLLRLISDPSRWQEYAVGFFTVSGIFLLIYLLTKGRGIGGGDIKLMAAAGLFLGWKRVLLALAIGSAAGSVIHIALMKLKNKDRVLAFGPYLAAGIFLSMLYGEELIGWYLRFCGLQ